MRYFPEPPPVIQSEDGRTISEYLYRQLLLLSGEQIYDLDKNGMSPDRVVDGMIRYANGTDWNPGSGEGMYIFFKNRWRFLTEISSDGYWEDYTADIGAAKPGLTNPPDFIAFRNGIVCAAFDDGTDEDVFVNFHIKHDFKEGSKIYPHCHWSPGNNTDTGTVRWGIEYSIAKGHQQEAFPATSTVYIEQAASTGTAYMHYIAETPTADALDSSSFEPDTVIMCRVFRDANHANDTFTGDAFLFQVDLHYQKSKVGTKNKRPDFNNDDFLEPPVGGISITGGTPTIS